MYLDKRRVKEINTWKNTQLVKNQNNSNYHLLLLKIKWYR